MHDPLLIKIPDRPHGRSGIFCLSEKFVDPAFAPKGDAVFRQQLGRNAQTGELLSDATSCSMCRRLVINAGLEKVVIRKTETEFEVVPVSDWVEEDDLVVPKEKLDAILDKQ